MLPISYSLFLSLLLIPASNSDIHIYESVYSYGAWSRLETEGFFARCLLGVGLASISKVEGCAETIRDHCWLDRIDQIAYMSEKTPTSSWTVHMGVSATRDVDTQAIIFYFSGPDPRSDEQTLVDLDRQEWAEFLPHCGKAPRVGQQFFEAWNVTKEIVSDTLAKLIVTHRDHHLVFLGHSSGGCLAQMFKLWAHRAGLWPVNHILAIGYGQPRCGNKVFADALAQTVGMVGRIYRLHDKFMDHPPLADPVENPIGYYHAGQQAIMALEDMSINATCVAPEPECLTAIQDTSMSQIDRHYFGWTPAEDYYNGGSCVWQ